MTLWTEEQLQKAVYNYNSFTDTQKSKVKALLDSTYSFEAYENQVSFTKEAVANMKEARSILGSATQIFPDTLDDSELSSTNEDLKGYGIVITAGGEGERLKVSLMDEGFTEEQLADFTKATWPLPGLSKELGALQINLKLLAEISEEIGVDIPVVVTTGPEGTTTARVIPEIIKAHNNFGLKNLDIIAQNEKLHLTKEHQIACKWRGEELTLATNPDETGGPIMKLKEEIDGISVLQKMKEQGAKKIMVLQGTAVYRPSLLSDIAKAGATVNGLGIGIKRDSFPAEDPYGTFVLVEESGVESLKIIEKDVRNSDTEALQNAAGAFLPYNTGFYAFDLELLEEHSLPAYASPDKIVLEGIDKAPKTGYAATDTIGSAAKSAVLTISQDDFAVLKNSSDLPHLSEAVSRYKLV